MHSTQKGENYSVSFSREGTAGERRVAIEKTLTPAGPKGIRVDHLLTGAYSGLFAVEMNISLRGSPHALIRRGGKAVNIGGSAGVHENVKGFSIRDKYLDLVIGFRFNEGVVVWHYPVETVSLSEEGVERLYQGTCFLFIRKMDFQGRKKMWFTMSFSEDGR